MSRRHARERTEKRLAGWIPDPIERSPLERRMNNIPWRRRLKWMIGLAKGDAKRLILDEQRRRAFTPPARQESQE